MTENNEGNKILEFKRNESKKDAEKSALELGTKINVINELTDDGIISPKERLRILKKLTD